MSRMTLSAMPHFLPSAFSVIFALTRAARIVSPYWLAIDREYSAPTRSDCREPIVDSVSRIFSWRLRTSLAASAASFRIRL